MTSQPLKNTGGNDQQPCYVRNHGIVERRVDDTVFVVNPKTDTVFYLNFLGTAIWRLLADPISAPEAAAIVQQAFPDVAPQQIAEDVCELLHELSKKSLALRQD